ncbi:hypothetical protein GRF29_28g149842 [Pseudopithomyces chartarum]|uniref:Uncharacterized protein n=1 Tax=Pseudopithomyces chartarum TaxID=1892770 RepID=A0AAN6M3B1_9PLEO|nr:hypothetical protein GRF29_28g149842 [Pseudopithomyces chartarum]
MKRHEVKVIRHKPNILPTSIFTNIVPLFDRNANVLPYPRHVRSIQRIHMQLAPISVHYKRDIKHVGRPRHQLISNSIAAIDLCRANRAPTSKPLDGRLSWKDDISVQTRSPHIRHMTPLNRHQSTSCRCTINLIPLLHLIQRTITLHAPLLPHNAQFYLHLYTPDVFEAEIAVGHDVVEGFFEVHAGDSAVVEDAVVDADAAVAGHPDGAGVDDVGVYAVVDDVFAVWGLGALPRRQ